MAGPQELARPRGLRNAHARAAHGYGLMVTLRMTGGLTGLLISPKGPLVVGVLAMASTTSIPLITRPKMT